MAHETHTRRRTSNVKTNQAEKLKYIIIITKYTSIAQDRKEAANALGNRYKWNRNVLSVFLNVASMMSVVCSSAGRLPHLTYYN